MPKHRHRDSTGAPQPVSRHAEKPNRRGVLGDVLAHLTGTTRRAPATPRQAGASPLPAATRGEIARVQRDQEISTAARLHRIRHVVLADYHATNARKARAATAERVRAGQFVGSVAPYGYRILRTPDIEHGGTQWARRLMPDPATADVIPVIFHWYVHNQISPAAIALRLAAHPEQYPPPVHPVTELPRRWTAGLVRRLLRNPIYTGCQYWGRTHHGHPAPRQDWVTSPSHAHEALIDERTFYQAQSRRHRAHHRPPRTPNAHQHGGRSVA